MAFNDRLMCPQWIIEKIVEESRLMRPSCSGLSCAEFRGTQKWFDIIRGRTFAESKVHLVLVRDFAICFLFEWVSGVEVLSWRVDSVVSGVIFCSPGAGLSDCRLWSWWLTDVFRWIVQLPSSLSSSVLSCDVYEWKQLKIGVVLKLWCSTSSEDQQRRKSGKTTWLDFCYCYCYYCWSSFLFVLTRTAPDFWLSLPLKCLSVNQNAFR